MKKVAIYGQAYKSIAIKEITILLECLTKHNIKVIFEHQFYTLLCELHKQKKVYETFDSFHSLAKDTDIMFTIGGDGTLLRGITYTRDSNIPLLGINTGRLGFLATINKNEIPQAIQLLIEKRYSIQKRSLLQIETSPNSENFKELNFALNEVTVARKNTTSMIGIKTFLNKEHLTNYWADGLIISTPTGSTGYSLSCNGPVISPDCNSIVITPIAPHNLNARPIIIKDNTIIELEVSSRENQFLISLDSRISTVPLETKIKIKKANFSIKTILLENQTFIKTLRSKLLWGEDTRNNV